MAAALLGEVVEGGQQLALGEVAGAAEGNGDALIHAAILSGVVDTRRESPYATRPAAGEAVIPRPTGRWP